MKFFIPIMVEMEIDGEVSDPSRIKFYALLAAAYAEAIVNMHGSPLAAIKVFGCEFQPLSMAATARPALYEGREPTLADAAHPEIIDAAVAVSRPGFDALMNESIKRFAAREVEVKETP